MTPSAELWRRLASVWLRNATAALAVLLVVKAALVVRDVSGPGRDAVWDLAAASLLYVGWDVVGATGAGALVALLALPLLRGPKGSPDRRAVLGLALGLQALHGLWCGAGYVLAVATGGFLDRATIELAALGAEGASSGASASIERYLGPGTLAFLFGLAALGAASVWLSPRLLRRLSGLPVRLAVGAAAALAVVTALLLPPLASGRLGGLRVRTDGLEASPDAELVGSYVRAALPRRAAAPADDWVLDLTPPGAPGSAPAGTAPAPLAAARPARTNVVLVLLESVGAAHLGGAPGPTPFLNATGRDADGAWFAQHYTPWPQTTKSYFSLLCSELPYPSHRPITALNPAIPCRSLPEVLRAEGWRTALVSSADMRYEHMDRFLRPRFDVLVDLHTLPGREGAWSNSWGVDERVAVREVLAQADAAGDRPFFVLYGMSVAHHPYDTCAEDEAHRLADDRAAYQRALRFVDARLAELWQGLAERGLLERTLVVIVSDHGEGFGAHPGSQSHGPAVWQENVHVPFALRGPQLAGLRLDVALPTSHPDVAPTVLGLLGLRPPCTMKGRDLVHDGAPRLVLFGGRGPLRQRGLVDGRRKYIRERNGAERVFDIIADPGERHDLLRWNRADAAHWRQRLAEWETFSRNLIPNYAAIAAAHGCR
jgi:arylsulfatase A-like enzyme